MRLLPGNLDSVLDIGARDGFISKLLAGHFPNVTALDLEEPRIDDERIRCVKGDVAGLNFPDASFDLVFCAEVIEHIPGRTLVRACGELSRGAREYLLIGVPYKQDLRAGRLTCQPCVYCGAKFRSPPERNLLQKSLTKIAFYVNEAQKAFSKRRPNWIHVLFQKRLAPV